MTSIKGFITNLGKYNEGELIGEWITFPIEEEELEKVLKRIGINEEYEEYFFTDYDFEDIPQLDLGEYESIDYLNEIAEKFEEFSEYDLNKFKACLEMWGYKETIERDMDDYNLYEDIKTEYDLGYYWIEESGCYDLSSMGNLANYIDYERFGRDINLESDGGFTSYGYIERI